MNFIKHGMQFKFVKTWSQVYKFLLAQFPVFNIDYVYCSAVKNAIKSIGTETSFEKSPVENDTMISINDSKHCVVQRPTRKHLIYFCYKEISTAGLEI